MQIVGPEGCPRKSLIMLGNEARKEVVAGFHVRDAGETQLLDQAVLQCPVRALDTTLGLAGIGSENLDVEFGKRSAELRHALAVDGVLLCHPEHRVLVGIEGDRATMLLEIVLNGFEIGKGAL